MLLKCSGWACMRLISVSKGRGGNPVALNDPENFAVEFTICEDCGDYFCDRCHEPGSRFRAPRCASCGGRLAPGKRLEQLAGRPRPPAVRHLRRGLELVESGRPEDALAEFGEAVRLRPEYASAHFWRGGALVQLDRDAEALDAFEDALRHNPADVAALYEKAGALVRMERDEEALAAYDRTIALQPGFPAPQLNRAEILLDADRAGDALAAADRVIALVASGRTRGGDAYDAANAHGVKGEALVRLGRFAEALPVLDYAIDNGPDSWHDHAARADALEGLGRAAEAAAARRVSDSLRES